MHEDREPASSLSWAISPVPENVRRFQGDKCLGVKRNDPGRKLLCRTSSWNRRRVAADALPNQGFSANHDLPNGLFAIGCVGIEFDLDCVRIHFVQMDLNIKVMMVARALDIHGAESQPGPMIGEM